MEGVEFISVSATPPQSPASATQAQPAPVVTQTTTQTPPVPPPPAPKDITVPYDQFSAYQQAIRENAEFRATQKAAESEAQRKLAEAQIQKGQAETAIKTIRDQHDKELGDAKAELSAVNERTKRFVRDKEVALATAGLPFVSPFAAQQFVTFIAPELDAYPEGDGFRVRTATFQSVDQLVAIARNDPKYAHFFVAQTQGGPRSQTTPSSTMPTPQNGQPPAEPQNLGDAAQARWNQLHPERKSSVGLGLGHRPVLTNVRLN